MVSLITFIFTCPIKLITVIVSFRLKTLTLPAVQMRNRERTLFTSNGAFQPARSSTLQPAFCCEPCMSVTITRMLERRLYFLSLVPIWKPNLTQYHMCNLLKRLLEKWWLLDLDSVSSISLPHLRTLNQSHQFFLQSASEGYPTCHVALES